MSEFYYEQLHVRALTIATYLHNDYSYDVSHLLMKFDYLYNVRFRQVMFCS